ncbi:MAG: amidohydrolase family protein [Spirulina sp. SIO3F2]|nr:amidohydrolase family protein [Spirulina sp. SIO3F2]
MQFTIHQALMPIPEGYQTIDVQVSAGKIAAIAPQLPTQGDAIDGTNQLLLPGFVNAHTHSSEFWQRGLIGPYPLELWLGELHEFSPLEPEQIYLSALATALETLHSGGTTVVDHLVLIPGQEVATVAAAVHAYREIGIRAVIGPLIYDQTLAQGIPDGGANRKSEGFAYTTTEMLSLMETVIAQFHAPEQGIEIMVAPTGIQLCSDDLFKGCIDLSDRFALCRHTHLLETQAQQRLAQEKYGCTAVEHLHRLGFLNQRTALAHCIWLTDSDISILAQTGATVVHNPLSNLRLGSGIAPIFKYRQAGINIAIGCDGAASNDGQDLLEAIKLSAILHNITEPDYRHWLKPSEAIEIAAQGGAQGLGQGQQRGRLTEGMSADLVLYDLTQLSLLPKTNPVGLLVLGRPCQAVRMAWVQGSCVIDQGQATQIDETRLRQDLLAYGNWLAHRPSTNIAQMETHYRQIMGLEP